MIYYNWNQDSPRVTNPGEPVEWVHVPITPLPEVIYLDNPRWVEIFEKALNNNNESI
jgi:hypothetical protein